MLRNNDLSMHTDRERDNQQWMLDWMIKTTGREQNFQYDERRFPAEAKTYRMIPRVMFKEAAHKERIARAADEAGYAETASSLYYEAVEVYRHGQHTIFEDDNPEKIHLHDRMSDCYDRIIALSDGCIERVEIEWEGSQLSGILHHAPGEGPKPLVIFCPGMDMTKEAQPHPVNNVFTRRGHCFGGQIVVSQVNRFADKFPVFGPSYEDLDTLLGRHRHVARLQFEQVF